MLGYAPTTSSGGGPVYSAIYADINGPIGWTFQTTIALNVTALGVLDYLVTRAGLEVGLWDSSGNLLASETITSADPPVNQSLYQSIAPVLLTASQACFFAAYASGLPLPAVVVTPGTAPNGYATMSPDIRLGEVALGENSGFAFPGTIEGNPGSAIIAPNFEYHAAPEPAAASLLGAGTIQQRWQVMVFV